MSGSALLVEAAGCSATCGARSSEVTVFPQSPWAPSIRDILDLMISPVDGECGNLISTIDRSPATTIEHPIGTAAKSMGIALLTLRGLVFLRKFREFGPAFGHRIENRGAPQRNATALGTCCAVRRTSSTLVSADHGLPPRICLSQQSR